MRDVVWVDIVRDRAVTGVGNGMVREMAEDGVALVRVVAGEVLKARDMDVAGVLRPGMGWGWCWMGFV